MIICLYEIFVCFSRYIKTIFPQTYPTKNVKKRQLLYSNSVVRIIVLQDMHLKTYLDDIDI